LFVLSVLSYISGIYLQAVCSFPTLPLLLLLFLSAILIPILRLRHTLHDVVIPLILVCFMVTGMVRLEIDRIQTAPVSITADKELYEGLVIETSSNTKVIRLSRPVHLRGLKVIFRNSDALDINDSVRVFGEIRELALTFNNPSLTSWKWLKRLEGISYQVKGTLLTVLPGESLIHGWRKKLREKVDRSGAQWAPVIRALTIGDTTGLDDETKGLFLRTGTSHILAISGSNIGIVTAFFFFLARLAIGRSSRKLRLRGDHIRYASLLSIPFAFIFMLIAGSGIPTIRATIMIAVFMLAVFFERSRHVVNTIALSGLIVLVIYPHSLFMPTFQLTFMSVLFLVLFTGRLYPLLIRLNRPVKWLFSSVLMTAAATIGTLPIVIYHFYGVNPFSLIHNLISVPLMCIIAMPLSLVGLVIPYGESLLRLSGDILNLNMVILRHLDAGYIFPIVRPNLSEILLYFLVILGVLHAQRRPVLLLLLLLILPLSLLQVYFTYRDRFHNDFRLNLLDVGLGEAILVEGPKGVRLLIDGGGFYRGDYDVGKSIIAPILLARKIRTLDCVINTHPHGDHVGGLPYIMKNFQVKRFATSGYFIREGGFLEMLKLVREKGIRFERWKEGESHFFGPDLKILVLNPPSDPSPENLNNASLVLKLGSKGRSLLLSGDIDRELEEQLILSGIDLRADILKVPHHGSKNSSGPAFIRSVAPRIAVMSTGRGIQGLPSEETLQNYSRLSIPLLRTDRDGFVQVAFKEQGITWSTYQRK
jgi:competence protein ComEC